MSIGPVEYIIVGFPGNQFNGEIAPALADLIASRHHPHPRPRLHRQGRRRQPRGRRVRRARRPRRASVTSTATSVASSRTTTSSTPPRRSSPTRRLRCSSGRTPGRSPSSTPCGRRVASSSRAPGSPMISSSRPSPTSKWSADRPHRPRPTGAHHARKTPHRPRRRHHVGRRRHRRTDPKPGRPS